MKRHRARGLRQDNDNEQWRKRSNNENRKESGRHSVTLIRRKNGDETFASSLSFRLSSSFSLNPFSFLFSLFHLLLFLSKYNINLLHVASMFMFHSTFSFELVQLVNEKVHDRSVGCDENCENFTIIPISVFTFNYNHCEIGLRDVILYFHRETSSTFFYPQKKMVQDRNYIFIEKSTKFHFDTPRHSLGGKFSRLNRIS